MIDSVFNSLRTLPAFLTNILYVYEEEKEAGKRLIILKNAAHSIQLIFFFSIVIFMYHFFDFPFLFSNHYIIPRKQNYCFAVYVTKLTLYINVCERDTS